MIYELFYHVYRYPLLTKNAIETIADAHQSMSVKKGQLLLETGKIAHEYYLIEQGLFRSFSYDYNGNEVTTGFNGHNEILIEVSSLFQRIPSRENLQALTDGKLWKIDLTTFQGLYESIDGFSEWGRSWMSNQLFQAKQRSIDMVTISATDRYIRLVDESPQIIQQAPLKHIASYLGVTDSSLSRIRKEMLSE